MSINKFYSFRYTQYGQEYLSLILPFHIIDSYSHVMVYGDGPYGYQRKPEKQHYNKIVKYLLDEGNSRILPTSIILGADKEVINKMLSRDDSGNWTITFEGVEGKIFRIVDGQHRIAGIRSAAETKGELADYTLNVVILLIDDNKRSSELSVFTDINSKSKRIRVDLAELARHNYEIIENKIENLNKHIAIKIAYRLKEMESSVWYKAIKFDIHSDIVLGIVGVNMFCESIEPIIARYLELHTVKIPTTPLQLISFTDLAADEIVNTVYIAWESVAYKWNKCFDRVIVYDDESQMFEVKYNKNYYLQKTLGVKTINGILCDIIHESDTTEVALVKFKTRINDSRLKSDDWLAGKLFSGMTSESGVSKAKQLVMRQKEQEELF